MSWWSAEPTRSVPAPTPAARQLRSALEADGFLFDLESAQALEVLRQDVRRIASCMDRGDGAPPMLWTGIPLPSLAAPADSEFVLSVSVGGTKTEFSLLRFERGQVVALDPDGVERSGEEASRLKEHLRILTPTQSETPSGLDMVQRIAEPIAAYLAPHGHRIARSLRIVLSWGFANKVVRKAPSVLGGISALTTRMTKEQTAFTADLEGKDVGALFGSALERILGWSAPVTVANDGVMALHYFFTRQNVERHGRFGLFINGTGTNFAAAELYAVRPEGVVSRPSEEYCPERITSERPARKGERVEPYFVNYETGSIELGATKTRYDVSSEYPIESNTLSGGNAFEQQLREVSRVRLPPGLYDRCLASWRRAEPDRDPPRGPEVARLAAEGAPAVEALFPGAAGDAAELLVLLARAIVTRSALHAALILAAVTERNSFGLGSPSVRPGMEDGEKRPDLLAVEGSVWRTEGYPDLMLRAWQALVGSRPLDVRIAHERSFDASFPGPLYFAFLHE
jgi:hypothetical protein